MELRYCSLQKKKKSHKCACVCGALTYAVDVVGVQLEAKGTATRVAPAISGTQQAQMSAFIVLYKDCQLQKKYDGGSKCSSTHFVFFVNNAEK